MNRILSAFIVTVLSTSLVALERSPWMGEALTADVTLSQEHTSSTKVDGEHGSFHKRLYNNITRLNALVTPLSDLSAEFELSCNQSQKYSFNLDALKVGVRKQWLNDLVADKFSLATGASLAFPYWGHLRDLSSQNHGKLELELNCSIGKQFAITETRYWKTWIAAYAGQAIEGRPWLGAELHLGAVFRDTHLLDVFLDAEKGFGNHKLKKSTHFRSWSHMDYAYIDLGARYTYQGTTRWQLYGQAARRLTAHLCPQNVWSLEVGVMIPFGL